MIVMDRTSYRRVGALLASALATGVVSCASNEGGTVGIGNNAQDVQEATSVQRRSEIIGRKERTQMPTPVPASGKAKSDIEAPAALLGAVKDDLARRVLVKPDTITVVSAVEVTWPTGALGCSRPGVEYIQAVVQGYKIVLAAAGKEHPYHSDMRGRFIYCDQGLSRDPVKEQLTDPPPAQ
jgi:hypothetical protein